FENNCVFGNGTNFSEFPNPIGTFGNISVNPQLLTNAYAPNGYLLASSPCRDAGTNTYVEPGWLDVDGGPRVVGARVELGADEFNGAPPAFEPVILRVDTSGDDSNDGLSWTNAMRTIQAAVNRVTSTGGEVWVKAGVYYENPDLRHFAHLYGGFSGSE